MEKKNIINWCQRATKEIQFKKDREAVTLELYHHLEDHYDALIDSGLSPAEAEKQALDAMGSAEEIAPQLAAIHTPWLGYTYLLVRGLAVILAVCAIFISLSDWVSFFHTLINTRNFDAIAANHEALDYYCQPNVSDWSDGYRFQVTEAGYSKAESRLYFELEMIYWPWLFRGDITHQIWAVDSLGNYYDARANTDYFDPTTIKTGSWMSSRQICTYNLWINGFDCDAQWVELHYDRDGRNLTLRIDLTGGAGNE